MTELEHNDAPMGQSARVGAQVLFAENEAHPRVLGVITRVWPSPSLNVTVVSDGRTFVRRIDRVEPCHD